MNTDTKTPRKPRKMKPFSTQWEAKANALARDYCPEIVPCRFCGGPRITIYVCDRCGKDE